MQRGISHEAILDAALLEAEAVGYLLIKRDAVAARAGVAPATINSNFGTIDALREAVLVAAIERANLVILAQGLAAGAAAAKAAPGALKHAALAAVS